MNGVPTLWVPKREGPIVRWIDQELRTERSRGLHQEPGLHIELCRLDGAYPLPPARRAVTDRLRGHPTWAMSSPSRSLVKFQTRSS